MHAHPESVTIYLTGCEARFTYPNGKTEDVKHKAGQVLYHEACEHLPQNVGKQALEHIQIELK